MLLIITISGCSTSPVVTFTEKNYETDIATVDVQLPELKNLENTEFQEKFNNDYSTSVTAMIESFYGQCPEDSIEKCIFHLSQQIFYNKNPIISIVGDLYVFTEGIHGISDRIVKNIDTQKAVEINLSDIFTDESYEQMINREINKILEQNKEEYSDLWEKPILTTAHEKNFYFSENGLVIFYLPYELSYYARGFIDFTIPYEEVRKYMKDEYREYFI